MLVHLSEPEILAIVELAELNNSAHPESEIGITQEEGRERSGGPFRHAEREALKQAISSLSLQARLELIALIWFARGNAPKDSFAVHLTLAKADPGAGDVDYIAEKSPSLPMYLRNGMDRLISD
jgi:Protein of unknown function (DUF3775)